MTNSTSTAIPVQGEEKIIGLPEQHYCLTPTELRTMAEAAEKMENLGIEGDQTLVLNIEGLRYRVTFGWDDTGSFGVLAAWMAGDENGREVQP